MPNKDIEKERATHRKSSRKRRKKFSDYIRALKLKAGCAICGYNEHACAVEFDHIDPSQKLFNVASGKDHSWSDFLAEIAKCRILCANCHAVETHAT